MCVRPQTPPRQYYLEVPPMPAILIALVVSSTFGVQRPSSIGSVHAAVALLRQTPTPARTPDVIYVPTPSDVFDAMLKVADVKPTDMVYDLGCGDGRIVIAAAQKYGARGVGIDLD